MLDALFGSRSAAQALLYLQCYDDGYASGMARTFSTSVSQVQKQLLKFESAGILVSRTTGNVRVFTWSPHCSLVPELRTLLQAALDVKPEAELEAHFRERRRPRRAGKPL